MSNEKHSMLSPSGAHRYLRCPVAPVREQKYPEATTAYAEEGTLAHALAAALLLEKSEPAGIPEDMRAPVGVYVAAVRAMSAGATVARVEVNLDLSVVLGAGEKGTADYFAIVGEELQVHDLKYGKGVAVDAQDNDQLMLYGLGALEIAEHITDVKQVRLVIHQPRLNSVTEAVYGTSELRDWGAKAKAIAEAIRGMSPDDPANPGEKQCRWCKAKADCPELAAVCRASVNEFDDLEKVTAYSAADMNRLAASYALIATIRLWISAVEDAAMARMLDGAEMPGFKLVEGRPGNRQWSDDAEAEAKLKALKLKVGEMYTHKVITPTAAEKLLAKSAPAKWSKLQALITKRPPAPAIVPQSDKRPEMSVKAGVDEFDTV